MARVWFSLHAKYELRSCQECRVMKHLLKIMIMLIICCIKFKLKIKITFGQFKIQITRITYFLIKSKEQARNLSISLQHVSEKTYKGGAGR